ncbi:complement factor H-like isoform X1 [Xyrichtys novacula]|uniref:Complement factor H-like isoform X1 n=1 Tax=Xyrichtys novacula TaxID=13765 RepID=A0AAV1GFQ2_XYRNO|nr:complement factor H-like isoform X1 [Xyrichtys novacula]
MCVRYLLLVCFLGVLKDSCAAQSCQAPILNGGFLVPEQNTYSNQEKITYACEYGHKPVVEGWWATSTCQDGKWIPEPQCINETACLPPTIPNAVYTTSPDGWYEEGEKIRVSCDKGYKLINRDATAVCVNGTWSSMPVCRKSDHSCSEPPQVPHAVIVGQKYHEVFAVDSMVQYECENGYTMEDDSTKTVFCMSGNWSERPVCSSRMRPTTGDGHGGSTGGGEGDRPSTDRETPPAGGAGTGHGSAGGGHTTSSGRAPPHVEISHCGTYPTVPEGDVVMTTTWFLKYICNYFYKLEGPETVLCNRDGSWTRTPICRAVFCNINTDQHSWLVPVGNKLLQHGETEEFKCVKLKRWWTDHYSVAKCLNGRYTLQK